MSDHSVSYYLGCFCGLLFETEPVSFLTFLIDVETALCCTLQLMES